MRVVEARSMGIPSAAILLVSWRIVEEPVAVAVAELVLVLKWPPTRKMAPTITTTAEFPGRRVAGTNIETPMKMKMVAILLLLGCGIV